MPLCKYVVGALLIGACNADPSSGVLDPFGGPSRGVASTNGGGGSGDDNGSGGSGDGFDGGGSADALETSDGGGGDGGGEPAVWNDHSGAGGWVGSGVDGAPPLPDADSSSDAFTCSGGTNDLSNVGPGNFEIAFQIVTTQQGLMALLNQRAVCTYAAFWAIRQSASGKVLIELDNASPASYESLESTRTINDGQPHDVVVARAGGKLTIRVDGAPAGQRASSTPLGLMPPLRVGDDVCTNAVKNPPTLPLNGTLSAPCITRN